MDDNQAKQVLISSLCNDLKRIIISSSIRNVEHLLGKEFCKHIFVNPYGCWIWNYSQKRFQAENKKFTGGVWSARKYVWDKVIAVPLKGYLDVSCGNIRCVIPTHLKPLVGFNKRRHGTPQQKKFAAITKTQPKCEFCGTINNLTIDHITPRGWMNLQNIYKDGHYMIEKSFNAYAIDNQQVLCYICNHTKSKYESKLRSEFVFCATEDALTKDYIKALAEYSLEQKIKFNQNGFKHGV